MIEFIDSPRNIASHIASRAKARRIALNLTQAELSARSGVPLGTLKRFEQTGAGALQTVLELAEILDCLPAFSELFPPVEAQSLDDIAPVKPRQRVRK